MMLYARPVNRCLSAAALHDAAYALLFDMLRTDWGVSSPHIEKTALGKPYLSGVQMPHISLSHTRGLVCCAISKTPVGVDCERPRRVTQGAIQRVCTPAECADIRAAADPAARFLQYWTLKESISKKLGVGLSQSFQSYEIRFTDAGPVCTGHRLRLVQCGDFFLAAAE